MHVYDQTLKLNVLKQRLTEQETANASQEHEIQMLLQKRKTASNELEILSNQLQQTVDNCSDIKYQEMEEKINALRQSGNFFFWRHFLLIFNNIIQVSKQQETHQQLQLKLKNKKNERESKRKKTILHFPITFLFHKKVERMEIEFELDSKRTKQTSTHTNDIRCFRFARRKKID